ncbi:MAG: TRAP transporter small permease subunit [Alphaproteobacteria bacterium]|nr:TRAP transporter small permease subunit [Alphaproteobacteria bacterium SS10]
MTLLLIVLITAVNAGGFIADRIAGLFGGSVPGLPGYEDAVTMLVGVAVLALFPYCQRHGGHITVDSFAGFLPAWWPRLMAPLAAIATSVVALGLAGMMVLGLGELRADGALTPVLGWVIWPFLIPGIFSCLLWAIAALMPPADEEGQTDG